MGSRARRAHPTLSQIMPLSYPKAIIEKSLLKCRKRSLPRAPTILTIGLPRPGMYALFLSCSLFIGSKERWYYGIGKQKKTQQWRFYGLTVMTRQCVKNEMLRNNGIRKEDVCTPFHSKNVTHQSLLTSLLTVVVPCN
jgi:hypothetical protein